MTDTIDFDMKGTESAANKIKILTKQTDGLSKSFERLNKVGSAGAFGKMGGGAGGSAGGIVGVAQMVALQQGISKLSQLLAFSPAAGAITVLAGAAIAPALMDRRIQAMVSKASVKVKEFIDWSMKKIGGILNEAGKLMANVFNNGKYGPSQLNEIQAVQMQMQKRQMYIEQERARLLESNIGRNPADVLVKELMEFFKKKDAERNKQIAGILDMMKMEGRL